MKWYYLWHAPDDLSDEADYDGLFDSREEALAPAVAHIKAAVNKTPEEITKAVETLIQSSWVEFNGLCYGIYGIPDHDD